MALGTPVDVTLLETHHPRLHMSGEGWKGEEMSPEVWACDTALPAQRTTLGTGKEAADQMSQQGFKKAQVFCFCFSDPQLLEALGLHPITLAAPKLWRLRAIRSHTDVSCHAAGPGLAHGVIISTSRCTAPRTLDRQCQHQTKPEGPGTLTLGTVAWKFILLSSAGLHEKICIREASGTARHQPGLRLPGLTFPGILSLQVSSGGGWGGGHACNPSTWEVKAGRSP